MSCLGFCNIYFDETIIIVQGSYTRDILQKLYKNLYKTIQKPILRTL